MPRASSKKIEPRLHWTRSRARAALNAQPAPSTTTSNDRSSPQVVASVTAKPRESSSILSIKPHILPHPVAQAAQEHPILFPTESSPKDSDTLADIEAGRSKTYRDQLVRDLGEKVHTVSHAWTSRLYLDLLSDDSIDEFLHGSESGYVLDADGTGRWVAIPQSPRHKSELHGPVTIVIRSIVGALSQSDLLGVSREVVNSNAVGFKQKHYAHSCPDISVRATGPSFQLPSKGYEYIDGIAFSNVSAVLDTQLDAESADEDEEVLQTAIYCREIWYRQPNRNFVRSLIVTESRVRLLHYDRSGAYVTPFIDIHRDPRTFVRLVSGLTSPSEEVLGFDTTIRWKTDVLSGERTAGVVDVVDPEGRHTPYEIDLSAPPYIRPNITGRGTTCWYATHPTTGQRVFVKDAWRDSSKQSEAEFLASTVGVPGVVQMLSFQDNLAHTRDYRPVSFGDGQFVGRTKSRIVMELCGTSIDHFTSRLQAIGALRDAIVAHRQLWKRSVLHRDISMNNILLALEGVTGARGKLVDLDMAMWTDTLREELAKEIPIGTRRFQSVLVTRSFCLERHLPHDYLDDLESFFYVLCHLVMLFDKPGSRLPEIEDELAQWDCENPRTSALYKRAFVGSGLITVSAWWGDACQTLADGFRETMADIVKMRNAIQDKRLVEFEAKLEEAERFSAKEAQKCYEKVVRLFDEALVSIEKEDRTQQLSTSVHPATIDCVTDARKRRADDALPERDPLPWVKRSR